jgi:hypothetical protein
MKSMKKSELMRIWKLLDGGCEALERLSHDEEGLNLLKEHENRIDFSAIVNLKNEIEELAFAKSRKKVEI